MQSNQKILIGAFAILMLSLVAYSSSSLTGLVVNNQNPTSITFSQEAYHLGETIEITVDPETFIRGRVSLHGPQGEKMIETSLACSEYKCPDRIDDTFTTTFGIRTSSAWEAPEEGEGEYYIRIYDYATEGYITEEIEILPPASNPYVR